MSRVENAVTETVEEGLAAPVCVALRTVSVESRAVSQHFPTPN